MTAEPIADVRVRSGAESAHAGAARTMFERIAPTYDVLNRLMSAGVDRRWRNEAAAELRTAPPGAFLDLCAGTMDFTSLLAREYPGRRVVAVDFSPAMLDAGRHKAPRAETIVADATSLPFGSAEFAAIVCGFGMRNLGDPVAGAREALRVLRPGGIFVTLELFRSTRLTTRLFHETYARVVLPTMGALVARDRAAYRYLAKSMAGFLTRDEYERKLTDVGFRTIRGYDLTLGVASIVCAEVAP